MISFFLSIFLLSVSSKLNISKWFLLTLLWEVLGFVVVNKGNHNHTQTLRMTYEYRQFLQFSGNINPIVCQEIH